MGKQYLYEHPDKPGVFVSRQRIWALKHFNKYICIQCNEPIEVGYAVYCNYHRLENNKRTKKHYAKLHNKL